jgi:hypothetical protein
MCGFNQTLYCMRLQIEGTHQCRGTEQSERLAKYYQVVIEIMCPAMYYRRGPITGHREALYGQDQALRFANPCLTMSKWPLKP